MRHNSVVSGHPKSTGIPRVDRLSVGPPEIGVSHSSCNTLRNKALYINILDFKILKKLIESNINFSQEISTFIMLK